MEIEKLKLLSNCNNLTKSHEIFEKEVNGRFKSVTEILEITKNILEKNKDEIKTRRLEFSEEIKVWKAKMKSETKKALVIAIIEMSLCVAMIIIRPDGIINLIETVKKVSDLIKAIKIDNIALCDAYNIIQITKKIKEIEKLGNGINRLETNMAIESEFIESMNVDLLAKILETDDQKGILMNPEWKIMEKLLEFPINHKIKGTKDYLNSLTKFFTFIDAHIKAKISCWIMIYMENYLGAYEYWSLSRSKLNLSVIKPFSEHRKDIEMINNELESSYHRFQDKPQHFRNRSIIINEEKYIEEFIIIDALQLKFFKIIINYQ
ncbi:hypothetical protein F8M41_020353 [Gigaspora margarita]|uniref:Uncharacterized protein n=1 Tax=Gigaspora margarita TaxID=4874 RepID=A0A8H4AII9_GIGMA|nr:hypothetical protein F8M41_020353 [Gigaspora margarita]